MKRATTAAAMHNLTRAANLVTGRCRPLQAVVQKGTDAEQQRRKRISFLAEIENPIPTKMPITTTAMILNMASEVAGSADRTRSVWPRASLRKCAVGP